MQIMNFEQGTDLWFKSRQGIPSASCFDKIVTTTGSPSKQAKTYMYRLAGETVSGLTEDTYSNAAMQRGIELEKDAREAYEGLKNVVVDQVGFCIAEKPHPLVGCSPDGLIKEHGMIEIKCPLASTHVGYLLDNKLPTKYFQQVQGQLYVTGRDWCDFMSYYPNMKPLIVRVKRDEVFISCLNAELTKFCSNLAKIVEDIK